jgi:hypothetical protein
MDGAVKDLQHLSCYGASPVLSAALWLLMEKAGFKFRACKATPKTHVHCSSPSIRLQAIPSYNRHLYHVLS